MSKDNITIEKKSDSTDEKTSGQFALKRVRNKKKKKAIKTIIIIAVALILVFTISVFTGIAGSLISLFNLDGFISRIGLGGFFGLDNSSVSSQLTTYKVSTRSITQILTSSGTIEPNDQYTINALVSGEIISDYFEEGDTVVEDQPLYKIDSDNLNSSVTRAENALKNANKALDNALEELDKLDIESKVSGTIKKIYIEVGDEIGSNTLIADVVDNDTMCIDSPFIEIDCENISVGDKAIISFDTYEELQGYVTEISQVSHINTLGVRVRKVTVAVKNTGSITTSTKAYVKIGDAHCTSEESFYNNDEGQIFSKTAGEVSNIYFDEGDIINDGNIIAKLKSDDLEEQIDKLRDNVTEAEDALEDANDAYDNYNIEAPITGKVISKSYKTGDTISGGQIGSNTLAVIYDMSALKFNMNIDELDIDKLDEGQDVIVTCDSREGVEYHGTITNISIQGSTTSGTTVYPVEVTIENVEDISKRTVSEDGTVNKVYQTGMTSTEKTYKLLSTSKDNDTTIYNYSGDISIKVTSDGALYDNSKELKKYLDGTYTQGSSFYSFSNDMSSLTLEIQNDKKMLRPGMNIDAEIIVEYRENVVAVPLNAVGRGNVVKVITSSATSKDANKENVGTNTEAKDSHNGPDNNYGKADADTKYEEVRVTVGISDDNYVEITSGLNVDDIVIVDSVVAPDSLNLPFGMMGGGNMPAGGGMPGGMSGESGGHMPGGNMGGGPIGR